jgi:hypothetical protein
MQGNIKAADIASISWTGTSPPPILQVADAWDFRPPPMKHPATGRAIRESERSECNTVRIKLPAILPMKLKGDPDVNTFRRHGISNGSPTRGPLFLE